MPANSPAVGSVPHGVAVPIYQFSTYTARIRYNDIVGWIDLDHLVLGPECGRSEE